MGAVPGVGLSSKEGNGNPLQYSCLGNLMESQRAGHDLVTKQQQ